jgi:hypothetical protein|tara:strand:+ start:3240 stop:3485 length:246 start_codon:yes stop_codon:yes gene_type:complete
MGLGLKFLDPRNMKAMINIAKVSDGLDKHMKKTCAYCDLDMGAGDTFPVVEFLEHLAERHPDRISAKDVEDYKSVIKKVTK